MDNQKLLNDNRFRNVLAFAVLMGGHRVLSKSPDYLHEKFEHYIGSLDYMDDVGKYPWGMDMTNQQIFWNYIIKWSHKEE